MNIVSLNKKQLINRSDFDLHITTFLHYMRWGGGGILEKKLDSND